MPIVSLVYASRMVDTTTPQGLEEILAVSRERNPKVGITGVLCYDPDFFLQWIEGPRDAVNALYHKIYKDPRHTDVIMIDYNEVPARQFSSWAMAYISARKLDKSLVQKYCPGDGFDPYEMRSDSVRLFLIEASQTRVESE